MADTTKRRLTRRQRTALETLLRFGYGGTIVEIGGYHRPEYTDVHGLTVDNRTVESLLRRGFIEPTPGEFSRQYGITEKGREALK